jgi:hypothetical protein
MSCSSTFYSTLFELCGRIIGELATLYKVGEKCQVQAGKAVCVPEICPTKCDPGNALSVRRRNQTLIIYVEIRYGTQLCISGLIHDLHLWTYKNLGHTKKKEREFSSYIRKFRWDRLQSHIGGRAS